MFDQKFVADVMDASVVPLKAGMGLTQAVSHLVESRYPGLPVVNDENVVVGFLSEHDCLRYLISSSYYVDERVQVGDVMFRQALTASPKETALNLAERMEGGKPKIYPVVESGKYLGVVSRKHVMRALRDALTHSKALV